VLAARQELTRRLFDAARERLATVTTTAKRYQKLLTVLILEGM